MTCSVCGWKDWDGKSPHSWGGDNNAFQCLAVKSGGSSPDDYRRALDATHYRSKGKMAERRIRIELILRGNYKLRTYESLFEPGDYFL
jgi:hypothetical protein